MNTKIKQQVDALWATAKEFIVRDGGHEPLVFLLGSDYSIIGLVAIDCAGGSPTDALTLIIQQIKPFGFIFISEAWDRAPAADTAKVSKCEALTLQAVTREVAAMCKIDFARENREIVLWPDTEIQMDDSMPGVVIMGRVAKLADLLKVRQ